MSKRRRPQKKLNKVLLDVIISGEKNIMKIVKEEIILAMNMEI